MYAGYFDILYGRFWGTYSAHFCVGKGVKFSVLLRFDFWSLCNGLPQVVEPSSDAMTDAENKPEGELKPVKKAPLPEVDVYIQTLVLIFLLDLKLNDQVNHSLVRSFTILSKC